MADERKTYKVGKIELVQEELTLGQIEELANLMAAAGLESISQANFMEKITEVLKKDLVRFFKIILLPGEIGEEEFSAAVRKIRTSQAEEIVRDLFALNPTLQRLGVHIQALLAMAAMSFAGATSENLSTT